MVIYEWADAPYLGKADSADDDDLVPVRRRLISGYFRIKHILAENVRLHL
jgi:hypothetical protein